MTLDPATRAVYEERAVEWTAARVGKDLGPALRLCERLGDSTGPVADLGCGPGYHSAELPPSTIGLDASAAMLQLLGDRVPTAARIQGDVAHLPFASQSLTGAVAAAVYVHLDRPRLPLALRELHRVLTVDAPAELVFFAGDQDLTEMTAGDFAGRRFALWGDAHLADVVVGAGFEIEHWTHTETAHWPALAFGVRRLRSLPDTVGAGMDLLICGLNPSLHSADTGVGFGRSGNRFWPAALAAGTVTVDRDPLHALTHHHVGMTDLVKRATPRAAELTDDEYRQGVDRLDRLCSWLRPRAVCMVGLSGWRGAVDRKARAGWQDRTLGDSPVYVMPSTSGLNAHAQMPDLTRHLSEATAGPS